MLCTLRLAALLCASAAPVYQTVKGSENAEGLPICDDATLPSAVNNFCMRRDLATAVDGEMLVIQGERVGHPGHPVLNNVTVGFSAEPSSRNGSNRTRRQGGRKLLFGRFPGGACGSGGGGCGGGCGSGGCGGCGGCGGGKYCDYPCGACGSGGSGGGGRRRLRKYDPTTQALRAQLPQQPALADRGVTFTPGGTVAIAVNGIPFENHTMSAVFDSCLGHVDQKHLYHYHMPPICLLKLLGVPVPDDATFWRLRSTAHTHWLARAEPSPMVAWAMDGHAIFGPYDDQGRLVRANQHMALGLDSCNGKVVHGRYRYYLSVEPPHMPPCFRAPPLGSVTFEATDQVL